jgi:hypothetical protein
VAETSDEVTAAPAKEFNPGDLILCRSTTVGELLCPAVKSGGLYRASGYGDLIHMQYQDLLALKLRKSQYIYAPLFVVEDEDLLATPIWADVKAIYDKMFEEEDLDEFFKMTPAKIKSALKNAPKGFQNAVRVRAATKIADGSLDSMNRIKAIDEVLGTDLMNMM